MILPDTHGHDYYTSFYLLATFTNVLLLLWEGWRRGFPLRPWLTLVAASSLALILGTKLSTHPVGEWATVLFSNDALVSTARSILGGGVAVTLTVLALRRWLGLSWAVFDALALPLCAALVVQCVGCLLTGCCFGEPTASGWGLTYAAGSPAWWAQVQAGLLPAAAAHSLPVVPTQVLTLLLCAAVGGVLLATRHRRWPVGSWLLLQTGLLLLGRFGLDFWRDATSEPVAGDVYKVLGGRWLELQLWLLPAGLLALGGWWWRVRGPATSLLRSEAARPVPASRYLWVLLALLGFTGALSAMALTPPETLVVRGLLLAVLVVEVGQLLLAAVPTDAPRLAGLPLSLLLVGFVAISTAQTPSSSAGVAVDSLKQRTVILTGGGLSNYHEAEDDFRNSNSGCGGSQRLALQQQVRGGGGEVAIEKRFSSGRVNTWGGGVWVAQQRISLQPDPALGTDPYPTAFETLADIHLYQERHRQGKNLTFDYRLGLHIGILGYYSYFDNDHSRESALLMPELMLRVGTSTVYGQADLCYGAENALGAYTSRLGIGSSLDNGSRLLAGYAHSPHQPTSSMGFVSGLVRLPNTALSLEPYYATNFGRHNSFSLKLNYRISR